MDEEALRELLEDPEARAQVLAALSSAPPMVVPFWRRPGLLSAAASLLVAATAGLVYLRGPHQAPPALRETAVKAPAPTEAPPKPATEAAPRPAPAPAATAVSAEQALPAKALAKVASPSHQLADAQAPAPRAQAPSATAPAQAASMAGAVPGGVAGGVVGGAVGGVVSDGAEAQLRARNEQKAEARDDLARRAEAPRAAAEAPRPAAAAVEVLAAVAPEAKRAKERRGAQGPAGLVPSPTWSLEPLADGRTRVAISTALGVQAIVLKRSAAGVEVLKLKVGPDPEGTGLHWEGRVSLRAGEVLDLYQVDAPVAEPSKLPESGPVNGFRARIHPASR
jgi:hypothetical protein